MEREVRRQHYTKSRSLDDGGNSVSYIDAIEHKNGGGLGISNVSAELIKHAEAITARNMGS